VVFTNRHLAEIAIRKPETKAALREIEGIGPSKVDEHSEEVFLILSHKGEGE
jgi:superfamily II DNA helicase RecQ